MNRHLVSRPDIKLSDLQMEHMIVDDSKPATATGYSVLAMMMMSTFLWMVAIYGSISRTGRPLFSLLILDTQEVASGSKWTITFGLMSYCIARTSGNSPASAHNMVPECAPLNRDGRFGNGGLAGLSHCKWDQELLFYHGD
jgi:hypothetical protein